MRNLVHGEGKRNHMNAGSLQQKLAGKAKEQLMGEEEVLCIVDGSDLRKAASASLEYLDMVRDLDGELVPGYPTLNILGIGKSGCRALLYHKLYSSQAPGFKSRGLEIREALKKSHELLKEANVKRLLYVADSELDDEKVYRQLKEQQDDYLIRVQHKNRKVQSKGESCELAEAASLAPRLATMHLKLWVKEEGRKKRREVTANVYASPIITNWGEAWVVRVEPQGRQGKWQGLPKEGWLLLSSLPVVDEASAKRVVQAYLQRWSVEETFSWTKQLLGWEEVRVLEFEALRTLVAMAWVAAAFVFEMGATLDWPEVVMLAQLGGWVPHKKRLPGKKVMLRGLAQLLNYYATQAILRRDPETSRRLLEKFFGPGVEF